MAEILVKTLTRHRDSKSALYMTDWTAGDIIEIKPDGYYTGNKWGGAKRMGIVLCVDAALPEEYGKKVHYDPTPIYENGELIDPCDYSKMLGRSELIVDLTKILSDQELQDVFNHDLMVSPKTVKKSYLDLLVNRASRTELHAYDRQGSFTTGTIDVGPNGHSDANTWAEFESNIASLTGDLTGNCDEAYQDTTPVTVAGFSLNGHTLRFSCSGSGKHSGYDNGSANHMQHKCASGGSHCWYLQVACTLDGMVIWQNSSGSSDECVRAGVTGCTIKDSILHTGLLAADQDGIYVGDWDCVVNTENTIIYSARRAGVNMQSYSTSNGRTQVLNAKGVIVVHTGTHDAETEAGFHGRTEASGDSLTMNLFNCMSFDSGNDDCYSSTNNAGSQTWNIDYCIDDDNSIAGVVDNGTGNLASRTLADTDQGSGNYVIVNETALGSEDFCLTDLGNAKNNAQDAHAVATGPNSSLAMPSTDLVGTSRPQNTNYDIGAFEIESAGSTVQFASSIAAGSAASAIDIPVQRPLGASAVVGSDSSSVDLPVLRRLAAALAVSTNLAAADLAILRQFDSVIAAGSAVSAIYLPVQRPFGSAFLVESDVSAIGLSVLRQLAASLTASTGLSVIDLAILRQFATAIAARTGMSDIVISVLRTLVAQIETASATSGIDLDTALRLAAQIAASSATSAIDLPVQRPFGSAIIVGSDVSAIDVSVLRQLAVSMMASTGLSGIDLAILRKFASAIAAGTGTSNIAVSVLRNLVAQIETASATSGIDLDTALRLAAQIAASSAASGIDLPVQRPLGSATVAGSDVSAIDVSVLRQLAAALTASTGLSGIDLAIAILAVINTVIESVTAARTISSVTPERTVNSATPRRTIEPA